jgi:hypothetical protein
VYYTWSCVVNSLYNSVTTARVVCHPWSCPRRDCTTRVLNIVNVQILSTTQVIHRLSSIKSPIVNLIPHTHIKSKTHTHTHPLNHISLFVNIEGVYLHPNKIKNETPEDRDSQCHTETMMNTQVCKGVF